MKVEGNKLAGVMNSTETSKVVLNELVKRKRIRHFIDLNRLRLTLVRSGNKIVNSDFISTFKDLASLGLGKLIQGRDDKILRFEFFTSLMDIAKCAAEGKDLEFTPLDGKGLTPKVKGKRGRPRKTVVTSEVIKTSTPTTVEAGNLLVIPLRTNSFIRIQVPSNLNKQEAEFISKAIMSMTKVG
jgi:hypothetical protein